MTIVPFLVIVLLIAVNALYVAAEFATVSVRRSRVRQLAAQGNRQAESLLPVIEDAQKLDRYVAACQIGITLSSLVLGAYGQASLGRLLSGLLAGTGWLGEVVAASLAAGVVLVALTALQVVLGELVPKSLALQFPTQAALFAVIPMRWSLALYSWFIAVLNGSGLLILRLLGVEATGHRHIHSPDEIDLMIAESEDGGLLEPGEQRRLRRALRLGMLRVHQLMVPRPHIAAIDVNTPAEEALRKLAASPYTRLPVYEGSIDRILGVVHTKDATLALVEASDGQPLPALRDLMRPALAVPESLTADRFLARLREQRRQYAIALDEFGGVAGLVTLEDILTEMMGDVGDEFKADQAQAERLPDGRVRLPGLMRPDEVETWVGVLWEGEADTVGGLVTEALGRVPSAGERLTLQGVEVEVERVANHAIWSLLVVPAGREPESQAKSADAEGQ